MYLLPGTPFLTAPALDHFGLQLATLDELHAIVGRAKSLAARDPRVRVVEERTRVTHGPERSYTMTSAYIGFVLPLMIELQHLTVNDRPEPAPPV